MEVKNDYYPVTSLKPCQAWLIFWLEEDFALDIRNRPVTRNFSHLGSNKTYWDKR